MTKVIDVPEDESPSSPVFDAGHDAKMDKPQPASEPEAAPKLTYGSSAGKGLGQSKINGFRSLRDGPPRKRAPTSVLNSRAEKKGTVAKMLLDYQASHSNSHVRRNLRKCENCPAPISYKKPAGTKFCSNACKTAAARKRTDTIERDKVFQTAASIAQEKANAAQRLYNYGEVASEMRQSANRIGRDDVSFLATPAGVIAAHDGEPLPEIRVMVYTRELMPRNVKMELHGHNWSTSHPDVVELLGAARLDLGGQQSVPSTIGQIPRSSWLDGRGTALEQRLQHEIYIARLDDLLDGPERRVELFTISDNAYLSVELAAALEQVSHWEFRFRGDPGTWYSDGFDHVEPDTTIEDIDRYEDRRKVLEWVKAHENKPAYTHPSTPKDIYFHGRDDEELAFSDRRRIDPTPKPRPVEHLFDE